MPKEPSAATVKPQARRIGLIEVFDLIDDIWGYIERNEARTRHFGRLHDVHKEEFESIRTRLKAGRELLHPQSAAVAEKPKGNTDGNATDD